MTIMQHNLDGYGTAPTEWQRVHDTMASDLSQAPGTGGPDRHTPWLTTVNTDGTPHVAPLGMVALDSVWYFNSGLGTRKSRNLAANPRRVINVTTRPFDLVVEGSASRVTDAAETYGATRFEVSP